MSQLVREHFRKPIVLEFVSKIAFLNEEIVVQHATSDAADIVAFDSVNATSYTFGTAAEGGVYFVSVRPQDRAGNVGTWTDSVGTRVDLSAPSAVTALSGPSGYANLTSGVWTWGAATDADSGVASYEIAAGTAASSQDVLALTATLSTSFEVPGLPDSSEVFVRVRAVNSAGSPGPWSLALAVSVDRTPPPAPSLSAQPARWTNTTTLSWTWGAVTDSYAPVTNYLVRVGTSATGENVLREVSVPSTTYTMAGAPEGADLFFAVRSVDGAGNVGAFLVATAAQVDLTPPSSPTGLAGPSSPTGLPSITWNWSPSTDAGGGVIGYEVELGSRPGADDEQAWTATSATTFAFSKILSGRTYYLTVRAVDAVGWKSQPTLQAQGTQVDREPPGAPLVTVSANVTRLAAVDVVWTATTDAGPAGIGGYLVEVSGGGNTTTSPVDPVVFAYSLAGADGVTYAVRVRAVDAAGNVGPWSEPVSVMFDRSSPAFHGDLTGTVTGSNVVFSWQAATDATGTNLSYRLSIGTSPGGSDVVAGTPVNGNSYSIEGVPGTVYYAKLTATDAAGNSAVLEGPAGGVVVPQTGPGGNGVVVAIAATAAAIGVIAIAVVRKRRGAKAEVEQEQNHED